jgi:hypothetical protein
LIRQNEAAVPILKDKQKSTNWGAALILKQETIITIEAAGLISM